MGKEEQVEELSQEIDRQILELRDDAADHIYEKVIDRLGGNEALRAYFVGRLSVQQFVRLLVITLQEAQNYRPTQH